MLTKVQVKRYLERIGCEGAQETDEETLALLQKSHFLRVPYENLDILAGRALSLDNDDLYKKVVENGRGGYCFELNALFKELLLSMGYHVTSHFARFLLNERAIPKRRHHVLRVKTPEGDYLCDVGVGVSVPLLPVRIIEGEEQAVPYGRYRFRRDGFLGWVLTEKHGDGWRDLFSFTDEENLPHDFIATSFFCEKSPDSIFNKRIIISLKTPDGRVTMDGLTLRRFSSAGVIQREVSPDALADTLYSCFNLSLPACDMRVILDALGSCGGD